MVRKNKSSSIFNPHDLSAKKRHGIRKLSQPKKPNQSPSCLKLIVDATKLIPDDSKQIEHSDNYDHHREKSPELRRLGDRIDKGKKIGLSRQSSITRRRIGSSNKSQTILDTENGRDSCELDDNKMQAIKLIIMDEEIKDLSARPSIIEAPPNCMPHISMVIPTKPSKSIFKTDMAEAWKTIDDGQFYVERRLNELAPMCKNQYLKTRMAKSLEMLKEVKKSTSPNSSFHSAFRYIVDQDITKRKLSIAYQKNSELSGIKLKDVELRPDHLPMNAIRNSLELRLKTLEKQERSMARLVTNYKKRHDKPPGSFSIPGIETPKPNRYISNNTNHVSHFPN